MLRLKSLSESIKFFIELLELFLKLLNLSSFFLLHLFALETVLNCGPVFFFMITILSWQLLVFSLELLIAILQGSNFLFKLINLSALFLIKYLCKSDTCWLSERALRTAASSILIWTSAKSFWFLWSSSYWSLLI